MPVDSKYKEEWEKDKRFAAIHEAGHVVVTYARHRNAIAWISERENAKPGGVGFWGGMTAISGGNVQPEISVAGMVATLMDASSDFEPEKITQSWKDGLISPSRSDLESVPDDWDDRFIAVHTAWWLIYEFEVEFDAAVEELMETHQTMMIGDEEAWNYQCEWMDACDTGSTSNVVGSDNSTRNLLSWKDNGDPRLRFYPNEDVDGKDRTAMSAMRRDA